MRISDWSSDVCSSDLLQQVFNALACHPHSAEAPAPPSPDRWLPVIKLGESILEGARHGYALLVMLGRLIVDLVAMIRHPARAPWREISAQIYRAGAPALGITALVGFLIGVVISYRSEERRVGKEWVSQSRSGWWPYNK